MLVIFVLGRVLTWTLLPVIPQDPLLFQGTMRSNLDPFGLYDNAKLWAVLKRACLVQSDGSESSSLDEKRASEENSGQRKLTLDTEIDAGGTNLSVGQVRTLACAARLGTEPLSALARKLCPRACQGLAHYPFG